MEHNYIYDSCRCRIGCHVFCYASHICALQLRTCMLKQTSFFSGITAVKQPQPAVDSRTLYFCGTNSQYASAIVAVCSHNKWTRMTILYYGLGLYQELVDPVTTIAKSAGIKVESSFVDCTKNASITAALQLVRKTSRGLTFQCGFM